jgi:hypothetical protein
LISWLYLQLTNQSWDRNCLIMLFRVLISWSFLGLTNWSWDQNSKKTLLGDFDIMKNAVIKRSNNLCNPFLSISNLSNPKTSMTNLSNFKTSNHLKCRITYNIESLKDRKLILSNVSKTVLGKLELHLLYLY